jgi:hypothetical protein
MMIRAPAPAMAAMPAIHAASSVRNLAPTTTCPSGLNSMPPLACSDGGIASISESTPKVSHGPGSTDWRLRAIVDLPELEPPLRTITWVGIRSR